MCFIERIVENAKKFPEVPILADDTTPKGINYKQFFDLSGRVYNYLKSKGLGKEDFVMICLPRGIKPFIALTGILRNGSAFVIVEEDYAVERINFIKKDCNCKIVIDNDTWDEIQHFDPIEGCEATSDHDAAFAVYTSGTTGNPKGVIHEYGNLDRMCLSTGEGLAFTGDKFALVAPLNFIASTLIMTYGLTRVVFIYVVSYKTLKNPLLLGMFIKMNGITGTFLTPSHIRRLGNKLTGLGLKFCIIGSEPANEVYVEGFTIHNFYLMSESGFAVTHFIIDKLYKETPVGKSEFNHEILLLDDNGNPVKDGEEGEICFKNDFVRGYINLKEETEKAFRNGLYHTGDIARKDEKGNLVICGRLSDMAKVNGNRVEPGEIENVAKKILKIDWTAARIFDENGKVFIALYYKDNINIDSEKLQKEMQVYLPYYMIPSFFIHVDSVPLRPNGKMDRKALPKPDFNKFKEDYVEPRDDIEKKLCESFEKALGMQHIGIHDDFYQLGGDSLTSMDVIANCGLAGLTTTHIFKGRTVEKIAELYKQDNDAMSTEDLIAYNKKCMSYPQPLSYEQIYMVDYQIYTPMSTMYNLYQLIKLDKKVLDLNKLATSVKKAVFNHPAILTSFFFDEEGDMMQKYDESLYKDVLVEKTTEKEFEKIKDTLVKPFKIVNSPLFRCRIFETEEAGYLFMDIHHTIFDGTSSKLFFGDILKAYFDQELEPDYYYTCIRRRQKQTKTDLFKESKDYFEDKYSRTVWQKCPTIDNIDTRENKSDEIFSPLAIDIDNYNRLLKIYSITPNVFYICANLLAVSLYNKHKNIMLSWIYNGRSSAVEMNTAGLLFRNLPVAISFNKKMKLTNLYKDVLDQVNQGIEHSSYPYVEMEKKVVIDDMACVLYQDDLREIGDMPGLLGEVDIKHNDAASQNVLDIEILNRSDGPLIMLDYASSRYNTQSIDMYSKILNAVIKTFIKYVDTDTVTINTIVKNVYKELGLGNLFTRLLGVNWL